MCRPNYNVHIILFLKNRRDETRTQHKVRIRWIELSAIMISFCVGPWDTLFGDYFKNDAVTGRGPYVLGLFFILLQCMIIIFVGVLTQDLNDNFGVTSTFLMTYIGMSLMAPLLPIKLLMDRLGSSTMDDMRLGSNASFDSFADEYNKATSYADILWIGAKRTQDLVSDRDHQWNHRRHFLAALLVAPAMFMADWAFNTALFNTSVASAMVLLSTQGIFVYVLATLLSLEKFHRSKLLGVLMGIAGVFLTTMNDDDNPSSIKGDVMALLAALCYATYTILVRLFCPENEELYSMQLFLGYIGLICFIPLLPIAIWLSLKEQELNLSIIGLVSLKGLLDFCATDYLLFRSILLTSPTVASVGLGLTIPMALITDFVMGHTSVLSWCSLAGAAACLVGFVMANLAEAKPTAHEEKSLPPADLQEACNEFVATSV